MERVWRSVVGSEEEEEEEGGLQKRQEITRVRGKGARCFIHAQGVRLGSQYVAPNRNRDRNGFYPRGAAKRQGATGQCDML